MSQLMKLSFALIIASTVLTGCGAAAPQTTRPQAAATAGSAAIATAVSALAPTAAPTAIPQPTPTFAPPRSEDRTIADLLLKPTKESYPDTPVLIGVLGIEGDYAAALSSPFGQRPQFAWLKRESSGWRTVFLGSSPSGPQAELGVPISLTLASDTYSVMDAWMAKLQSGDGTALDGYVSVEALAGDYARVRFEPSDPAVRDGTTAFLKRTNDTWTELVAGTAFDPTTLNGLGIPEAVWPKN